MAESDSMDYRWTITTRRLWIPDSYYIPTLVVGKRNPETLIGGLGDVGLRHTYMPSFQRAYLVRLPSLKWPTTFFYQVEEI